MAMWCDSGVNERVGPADEWVCDLVHETFMTTGVRLSHFLFQRGQFTLCVNEPLRVLQGLGVSSSEQVYTIIVSTIMRILKA